MIRVVLIVAIYEFLYYGNRKEEGIETQLDASLKDEDEEEIKIRYNNLKISN